MTPEQRALRVKETALAVGFDAVGITDLTPVPHGEALAAWLARGMAGGMAYMHRQAPQRLEPSTIAPGATRAVVVTWHYPAADPAPAPGAGRVAKYARGRDYHTVLREPLEQLAGAIRALGNARTIADWHVDAGPVPERELAQRAGLGWIGKNTMLIDPRRGSFSFLASVLTDLDLAIDPPFEADRCGTCRRCLDACPTDAFVEERVLDSRRCVSYLTIEHRGEFDSALATLVGDWIFGCDVCQDVCPWNVKFAPSHENPNFEFTSTLAFIDLQDLLALGTAEFETRYGWTPLERPGARGMRRNARVAAANLRRTGSVPPPTAGASRPPPPQPAERRSRGNRAPTASRRSTPHDPSDPP